MNDLKKNQIGISIKQFAEMTGVSLPHAYRMVANKEVPSMKLGNRIVISRKYIEDQLQNFINKNANVDENIKNQSKLCLHYKEYGMRKGCEMTFLPTKISQKHCSNNCRNIYNQKTKRINLDIDKKKLKQGKYKIQEISCDNKFVFYFNKEEDGCWYFEYEPNKPKGYCKINFLKKRY